MILIRRFSILWLVLLIFISAPTLAQSPLRSGQANLLQSDLSATQGFDSQTIHTVQIENSGSEPLSYAVVDNADGSRGVTVAPTGEVIRGGDNSADNGSQRAAQFDRIANTNATLNRTNNRAVGFTPCFDGMADTFPCQDIDLLHYMPIGEISTDEGLVTLNDVWGWTAPNGREFALLGRNTGTSFIDISDTDNPIFLADLPTQTSASNWRDIKVIQDHAVIVSEASGHGLQIFPLTSLLALDTASAPHTISTDPADGEMYWYDGFGSAHNVVVNEANPNHVYAVGTDSLAGIPLPTGDNCLGGLHFVDVSDITNPTSAGCYALDGYTHDAQCVYYSGPDTEYTGREICFNSNEDTLTIVDVTNKSGLLGPVLLSRTTYTGVQYTHQGWLTDDQTRFLMNDELDENTDGINTTTYIWNVEDLDLPVLQKTYVSPNTSIDHNNYIKDDKVYQANYRSGLRILDAADIANGNLSEIAFFDVYPDDDNPDFGAMWSNYPYFPSDNVVMSSKNEGFFIVRETSLPLPAGCEATNDVAWLSVTPLDGQVPAGATASLNVTLDSTDLAAGAYITGLCIETDDPDNRYLKLPVSLTVESGRVALQQTTIDQTQPTNALTSQPLVVDNTGISPLFVSVNEGEANRGQDNAAIEPNPLLINLPDDPAARREALRKAYAADRQPHTNVRQVTSGYTPCINGMADIYPCSGIDMFAHMPLMTIGATSESQEGNDIWGWTDPASGREFALMGRTDGTAFIEVSDPFNPVFLANLPTQTSSSTWRDIKTVKDHAVIVADSAGDHGMQIFDLSKLLTIDVADAPIQLSTDPADGDITLYTGLASSHNVAANEESGFVYVVGEARTGDCLAGLNMIDLNDPANPTFAGCYELDAYIHDTQCVTYNGVDSAHVGKEICFNSAETHLGIVDVTDKANPVRLGTAFYPLSAYVHQGWLTEDHGYFVMNDELDEQLGMQPFTRSFVMDVTDLDLPFYKATFSSTEPAIDHNLYIKGNRMYETNYRAGLRILDISDIASGNLLNSQLEEIAFFDIYPADNNPSFNGSWSNYPYFESGIVIVSGIENGLFVLRPHEDLELCDHPTDLAWLSVAPANGTIAVDGSMTMNVTFNSEGLANGTYTAQLCIDTDDTTNPHLSVPVSLTVDDSTPLAISTLGQDAGNASTLLLTTLLVAAGLGTLFVVRRRVL